MARWAGLTPGEIEIKFTLAGDANLDGVVNSEDFTLLSTNFSETGRSWDQGDFNYDNTVNSEDFTLFADNLNRSASQFAGDLITSERIGRGERTGTRCCVASDVRRLRQTQLRRRRDHQPPLRIAPPAA